MTIEQLPPPAELELRLYRAGLRNARELLPAAAALLTAAGRPNQIREAFKVSVAHMTKLRKALGFVSEDEAPISPETVDALRCWAGVEKSSEEEPEEEKPSRPPLNGIAVPREGDEEQARRPGESRGDFIRRRAALIKR